MLDEMLVCPGHPEKHFLEMVATKKGQICGHSGDTVAFIDSYTLVHLNSESYVLEQCAQQKKGQKCEVLVNGLLATSTALTFEHSLVESSWSAQKERKVSKFTNNKYLTATQQIDKMKQLQTRAQEVEREVKWLQHIIERSVETNGTPVDPIFTMTF